MTADLLFRLLLGHLFGDYLFQSNEMALNKKKSIFWAAVHCSIWTLIVALFLYPELSPDTLGLKQCLATCVLIWISHFALDGFNLIDWWLHAIGSRSYQNCLDYCNNPENPPTNKQFMVSYTALVQTVADNAVHLLFLYIIIKVMVV